MNAVGIFLIEILQIYFYLVIAMVVLSWLISFQILNSRNQIVYAVQDFLQKITDPVLRPIRRYVPLIGGIDISPIILILLIGLVRNLILEYWFGWF